MMMLAAGTNQTAPVRFATFNIWELTAVKLNDVDAFGRGANRQLANAAEIVQRVRPDVLLVNEIDFDPDKRQNARLFSERYLAVSQHGQPPLRYPHIFFEPVNTGVPTGKDMDNDGRVGGAGDAQGFGAYPGQYGMALYSRFPINAADARTFCEFLWKDMPDNLMPDGKNGKPDWYTPDEAEILRLSSKSHWDIPLQIHNRLVHVLCAHPTPPVFDGDEDRNGRRNNDEIRLWRDYIAGGDSAAYIVDDQGRRGPLPPDASFVVLGDMNADPLRGGSTSMAQLLRVARVHDVAPTSRGAVANDVAGAPMYPERRTADFGRADYVLPSTDFQVIDAGVFWPSEGDVLCRLVADRGSSSDHHLVWVTAKFPD